MKLSSILLATFAIPVVSTSRWLRDKGRGDRDNETRKKRSKKNAEGLSGPPVDDFPPAGNIYRLPDSDAGDVRGPCPAINTLANHGFINRSGKEVLMTDLITALSAVYDVTEVFLRTPVEGAIANGLTTLVSGAPPDSMIIDDHLLDISDLGRRPGRQEHDASLVRTDSWFCNDEESKLANGDLIDALIAVGGTSKSFLTRADIAAFQHDRIRDTFMHNGDPFSSTLPSIGGIIIQKVLIMILGQDEALDRIDKTRLEQWLRNETIPDGYVPNPDRKHNPLNPNDPAFVVRAEFTEKINETINELLLVDVAKVPVNSRCPNYMPVEAFPPAANFYRLPDAAGGDARGPCPAINTLANHGFINRSGKEVLMTDLITALSAVYDVTEVFLRTPVDGAIANGLTTVVPGDAPSDSTRIEDHMLDISDLGRRPGRQEHDASLVRTDSWFCDDEESKLANDNLIDALIAVGGTSKSFLTVADIVAFQRDRINDTLMHNGDPVSSTLSSIGGITVQKILIMILGQDETLERIDKTRLEQWLRNETIPDGYVPNPDRKHNPLDSGDVAFSVRAEFTERINETINEFVIEGKVAVPANSRCSSKNE